MRQLPSSCFRFRRVLRLKKKMISKSMDSKIQRKIKRAQSIIASDIKNIEFHNEPTKFLAVCNAGLTTGLLQERILEEISAIEGIAVENVSMLPGKSFCFIEFQSTIDAKKAYDSMNGQTRLAQNNGVIYLSYCDNIPSIDNPWKSPPPPGLIVLVEFISPDEENILMDAIDWCDLGEQNQTLKHRQVKHYGFEFIYGANNVNPDQPLAQSIPHVCDFLWDRLSRLSPTFANFVPDQLTVNKYQPGHGIPPHCDTHSPFEDPIVSLSLGGDTVMDFHSTDQCKRSVDLRRRTLLLMSQESRYGWTHGIVPRMSDVVEVASGGGLTNRKRAERVSFTFRKLRKSQSPCCCKFKKLCDSQKTFEVPQQPTEIGKMAAKLEQENVHKVYNEIGSHFSETRHSPWPRVQDFIESLPDGAVLLDVGCGNGKYLNINENVTKIGCDRSEKLLSVCNERGFSTFKCDCLVLPLRDQTVDACISIAVIHHLSTRERRLRALSEMARILTTGGRALIYVWAKNQEADRKKSSYLRQNKLNNRPTDEDMKQTTKEVQIECLKNVGDVALPIHTNRTQFQHQDMLVPWKLKTGDSTFLRFYHVFEERELEKLCEDVAGIKVVQSYYDQGNWCVIFQKH